jgi:UPF0755 protein
MKILKVFLGIIASILILSPFASASFSYINAHKPIWANTFSPVVEKYEFFSVYITRIEEIVEQTINLAALYEAAGNPDMKYVAIIEGMRKEEIAKVYQKALGWDEIQTEEFANYLGCYPDEEEGTFYPAVYVVPKDASPDEIKETMHEKFDEKVATIAEKNQTISPVVNMDMIVRVASIIQREAAGKKDARLVSGIIWNRIFNGMKLDMDATLQYVKGNEDKWWPRVKSEDKYLESPYNTYMYKGLPPTAISNPGLWAIEAAINPQKTECIFYLHDAKRQIHCAKTYEQHKKNINIYLR